MSTKILRPLVAEFVATMLFVFVGAGSVAINALTSDGLGAVGIALSHGLALSILITATLRISGGHLNPAVSLGLWTAGKIDARTAGSYIGVQLAGALLAGVLVKLLLPAGAVNVTSAGAPALGDTTTFVQGVCVEALLTFFLVSAVFGTAVSPEAPPIGGFGIGLAAMVGVLVGGPLTGGALNPARAFGPAIVSGELVGQAVFWIGPVLGGVAAGVLWKFVLLPRDPAKF